MRHLIMLIALTCGALIAFGVLLASAEWRPQQQNALRINRVYAYRGWQSTGLQLDKGDKYTINAEGQWM